MKLADLLSDEPRYKYITYSYEDGIDLMLEIVGYALVFSIISVLIAFVLKKRKKECMTIFSSNMLTKTLAILVYRILEFKFVYEEIIACILFFICVMIESAIYNKVLKTKKKDGIILSIICNIIEVLLMLFITYNYGF